MQSVWFTSLLPFHTLLCTVTLLTFDKAGQYTLPGWYSNSNRHMYLHLQKGHEQTLCVYLKITPYVIVFGRQCRTALSTFYEPVL